MQIALQHRGSSTSGTSVRARLTLRAHLAQLLRQLHMKLCQTVIFGQASRLKPSTKLLRASTGGVKPQIVASDGFTSTSRRPWQKCPGRIGAGFATEWEEGPPAPRWSGRRGRRCRQRHVRAGGGRRCRRRHGGAGGGGGGAAGATEEREEGAPLLPPVPARPRWRR